MTLYHPNRDLDNFIILHILQSFCYHVVFAAGGILPPLGLPAVGAGRILRSILPGHPARHPSLRRDQGKQFDAAFREAILCGIRACVATKVNSSTRHFAMLLR
jgi:hypothetical protein